MDFTRRNVKNHHLHRRWWFFQDLELTSVTFDKDPKENILLKIVNDVLFYLQQ